MRTATRIDFPASIFMRIFLIFKICIQKTKTKTKRENNIVDIYFWVIKAKTNENKNELKPRRKPKRTKKGEEGKQKFRAASQ